MASCLMSESPYPSQNQDKFVLRLPDGMRDRIKAAAEKNNRSMNAEIVATLEAIYPEPDVNVDMFIDLFKHLDEHDQRQLLADIIKASAMSDDELRSNPIFRTLKPSTTRS